MARTRSEAPLDEPRAQGSSPFLRWAGSKRQLIPLLRNFWRSDYRGYVEPFCGSACLYFSVMPPQAVLGDLNRELITAYRTLRADPNRVIECLHRLPGGAKGYYQVRKVVPTEISDAELAARFIYLNHNCFNGLYRTNLQGRFNVPYGRHKKPRLINEQVLFSAAKALDSVLLVSGDFTNTLEYAARGDFVYLDPPYVAGKDSFIEYGANSFSRADLARLSEELNRLDSRGVAFVVSYCDTAAARQIFRRWKVRSAWVRRNIAGFAGSRRKIKELLATNIAG